MVLIAPDVARYAVNAQFLDRQCVNVLDMVVLDVAGSGSRAEQVKFVAEKLLQSWTSDILPVMSEAYTCRSVSWVDLSSASGSVGSVTSGGLANWPQSGALSVPMYSSAIATLVTKETTSARGQRAGRWFLAPPGEADVQNNIIGGPYLAALNSGLSDLVEHMTETGVGAANEYFPTVVHTKNVGTPTAPVVVYEGNTQITNFSAQARVSTQRRRNRR